MTDQTSGSPESGPAAPPPPGPYQAPPPGQYPQPGQYQPPPPGQQYQVPPGYVPEAPPGYKLKKKKPFYKRFWLFWGPLATLVIIIIIIVSIASAFNSATNTKHTVAYKVTGTGKADITYSSWDAGSNTDKTNNVNGATLPWTRTVTIKGDLSVVTLTATPSNILKSNRISCSLSVDGKVVSTDKNSTALVSCSGSGSGGS